MLQSKGSNPGSLGFKTFLPLDQAFRGVGLVGLIPEILRTCNFELLKKTITTHPIKFSPFAVLIPKAILTKSMHTWLT